MRLILSRKGFDSGTGRKPSPIFEDGTFGSLPIPDRGSPVSFGDILLAGRPLGPIVEQLTRGRIRSDFGAHLDPDLDGDALRRRPGWRPLFGQANAAQTVLRRGGVGPGDLFLFFGWFRLVQESAGGVTYRRGSEHHHVIFGWLQVGEVISVSNGNIPDWASDHPHVTYPHRHQNTLYFASDQLVLDGKPTGLSGGGCFRRIRSDMILTAPGESRSIWRVPRWLDARAGRPALGGHGDPKRWSEQDGELRLRSVARGQEFVLDLDHYPEAMVWLLDLLTDESPG